jgi:hypothetical protein
MKLKSAIIASFVMMANVAEAQVWNQHDMTITPLCGGTGTIFEWTLEYEMSDTEVVCMGGCDTTAFIDVWDYRPGGSDVLVCSVNVNVSADWSGSGSCFTPVLYGTGSFSCDLSGYYGGAAGNSLDLYYVMEPEIPGICGNPYWSSGTLALPECGSSGGNGTSQINCSGTSCSSTPNPLPSYAYAYNYWDPCQGGAYTWSATADFEANRDRGCVGGDATEGATGSCTGGVELTGSGTWQGSGTGVILVSLATDGANGSTGITSLTATCQGVGTASIDCLGTSCSTDPSPLPHQATADTTWDPCAGAAFTWRANGDFESGSDRFCVGGTATAGAGGGCTTGVELSGVGPWSGAAAGSITLSLATDASQASTGLSSLVATCNAGATAQISCSGRRCTSTPNPLPNDATAQTRWDPCNGGAFTWQASGDFEAGFDRACVGGLATAGNSAACASGDELTGAGPWSGTASGPVTVSLATDASTESAGIMGLDATCSGGPVPGAASIRCAGSTCTTSPMPLPDSATAMTSWDPCAGAGFSWTATGQMEGGIDRGCLGGVATAGSSGGCSGGSELTGDGPWDGTATGPVTISLATDESLSSQGFSVRLGACDGPPAGGAIDLSGTLAGITSSTRAGRKIRIAYDAENRGTVMAPAHANEIKLLPDGGTGDGYSLCRDRVEALAPGAKARRSLECLVPNEVPPGLWQVVVFIDSDNLVTESSEANNRLSSSLQVTGADDNPAGGASPDESSGGCRATHSPRTTPWGLWVGVALLVRRRKH